MKIKGYLLINGVTISDISRQLNVSRQAVHQTIKKEIKSCRIQTAVAAAIGKPVDEVFSVTEEEKAS